MLKPGGVLHLCCPNAEHLDNVNERIDATEAGGHVRAGYTFETFHELLAPIGFRIVKQIGLGGPVRQACNKRIIGAEERLGFPIAAATFFALVPFTFIDVKPRVPFCVYVRAVKS